MNQKALNALEYPKIIEKLTEKASSYMGKQLCKNLEPSIRSGNDSPDAGTDKRCFDKTIPKMDPFLLEMSKISVVL